ncbi:MAG TPA: ester cyclase [Thermoleophilia bacterium]|nr:ester cyclase [Thermoleophilia bacterium]
MSDADKATIRRFPLEVLNQGKLDLVDEILDDGYVEHMPLPGYPATREGLKSFVGSLRTTFPDIRYSVVSEIGEGDTVVQYVKATGTMRGDFGPMKATGKSATWEEMHIIRMRGGKAVEHWGVVDQLGMMQQVGLAPAPPISRAA